MQPRTPKGDVDDADDVDSSISFDRDKSEDSSEGVAKMGRKVRARKQANGPGDGVREPSEKDRRYQTDWIMRRHVRCKVAYELADVFCKN